MKRIFGLLTVFVFAFVLVGCGGKQKFYVLNWAQYINKDLLEKFEKEYNVKVVLDETAESNEIMYTRIKNNTQPYDIVIPSDYMIHRLYQENLLEKLDFSLIPNYKKEMFDENLNQLRDNYFESNQDYAVPYFWGSLGIMYNKSKAGVEEAVKANEWKVLFEADKLPQGSKVGMYLSSRDAIAAAELYLGKSINTKDNQVFTQVEAALKQFNYSRWGTDDLKEAVAEKNLDAALVYSGDFFDVLYNYLDNETEITFDMHVPQGANNIWFDAMVIPTTSQNKDLAHEFINFMLDEENALENAFEIGYCPTIYAVYQAMLEDEEIKEVVKHPGFYPGGVTGEVYEYLGSDIASKMDEILNRVR